MSSEYITTIILGKDHKGYYLKSALEGERGNLLTTSLEEEDILNFSKNLADQKVSLKFHLLISTPSYIRMGKVKEKSS